MKRYTLYFIVLCTALTISLPAAAEAVDFSFGVIQHPVETSNVDSLLADFIEETDSDNLAFVVTNGIKAEGEACTDDLYQRRKSLLESSKNGLIVSLAASDWVECKNEHGKSTANAKLSRLRDLFFVDEFSLGATRIPVTRQSTAAKFRTFVENARWEIGNVMFATINLPANNNHYVYDAGRNSEFEDRLVANRNWLNRVFNFASRDKAVALVLLSDASPLSQRLASTERRDGFTEIRKQLTTLAAGFHGKVLLIHRQPGKPMDASGITWNGNLGQLGLGTGWSKVTVDYGSPALFAVEHVTSQGSNATGNRSRKRKGEGIALR